MFTRCPKCKTVHPLSAAQIAHSRGLVSCGACGRVFSALSFLFDHWPSGQAHAPAEGPISGLPVLGAAPPAPDEVGQDDAEQGENQGKDQEEDLDKAPDGKPARLAWTAAAALLLVLTLVNAAWTFRGQLAQQPRIGAWLENTGWFMSQPEGLLKDPRQIQLVSRDMHTHPTRTGILVLSMTFVNLAKQSQEFPDLRVTLLDATSQIVARRRLLPADYLRPGADIRSGLAPDVYLPVLLELGDPGNRAVGFEIEFL